MILKRWSQILSAALESRNIVPHPPPSSFAYPTYYIDKPSNNLAWKDLLTPRKIDSFSRQLVVVMLYEETLWSL